LVPVKIPKLFKKIRTFRTLGVERTYKQDVRESCGLASHGFMVSSLVVWTGVD
jgi:hypothetical protein